MFGAAQPRTGTCASAWTSTARQPRAAPPRPGRAAARRGGPAPGAASRWPAPPRRAPAEADPEHGLPAEVRHEEPAGHGPVPGRHRDGAGPHSDRPAQFLPRVRRPQHRECRGLEQGAAHPLRHPRPDHPADRGRQRDPGRGQAEAGQSEAEQPQVPVPVAEPPCEDQQGGHRDEAATRAGPGRAIRSTWPSSATIVAPRVSTRSGAARPARPPRWPSARRQPSADALRLSGSDSRRT